MISLRAAPFSLEYLDKVIVKIQAHNPRGWSDDYPLNSAATAPLIQTEPLIMPAPTEGSATSRNVVELLWTQVTSPDDGGSPILSYNVYWDRGTGTWSNLVGQTSDYMLLKYSVGGSIVESGTYQFKIRAKNRWGFGPFS